MTFAALSAALHQGGLFLNLPLTLSVNGISNFESHLW